MNGKFDLLASGIVFFLFINHIQFQTYQIHYLNLIVLNSLILKTNTLINQVYHICKFTLSQPRFESLSEYTLGTTLNKLT